MTITVYGIANCDSVKKAKKLLDAKGIDYQFYDYKKQAPNADMLKRWIKEFGAEQVINKRGTTWRKLDPAHQALAEQGEQQQIQLLLANLSMIKRPILEKPASKKNTYDSIIGFKPEAIESFIN